MVLVGIDRVALLFMSSLNLQTPVQQQATLEFHMQFIENIPNCMCIKSIFFLNGTVMGDWRHWTQKILFQNERRLLFLCQNFILEKKNPIIRSN